MSLIGSSYTLILGLGIAGLACARHLLAQGVPVKVADTRSDVAGLDQLKQDYPALEFRVGDTLNPDWIALANEVVLAPGLALDDPILSVANANGVPLIGELDLLRRAQPDLPIIAITGTNGKSTVTTLTGEMLRACGIQVAVGGNLGRPMLDLLTDGAEMLVLELSSFQLERAQPFQPRVATVLNMSPDHLDRHGSMPQYYQAKHRIFRGAKACVVNHEDALSRPLVGDNLEVFEFSQFASDFRRFGLDGQGADRAIAYKFDPLIRVSDVAMVGQHNLANAMASLAIVQALGLDLAPALDCLKTFKGLPHRGVACGSIGGVLCVNDSKGTNEGASIAALQGLSQSIPGQVLMLVGGVGKGTQYQALAKAVAQTDAS